MQTIEEGLKYMFTENTNDEFEDKFYLHIDMLYRICKVYLNNNSNIDDVIQETFIKLIYKSPKFKTTDDEKRWLVRVCINICRNYIKAMDNRNVSLDVVENVGFIPETNEIIQIMKTLPEKFKTALYLYYTEEFSVEEIAKMLSVTQSAVKMRLKRGRDLLRKKLEE